MKKIYYLDELIKINLNTLLYRTVMNYYFELNNIILLNPKSKFEQNSIYLSIFKFKNVLQKN